MSEVFIFGLAGLEDLNIGFGEFSSITPSGANETFHKIGIQSFLGLDFLNADDQPGATSADKIDAAVSELGGDIGVIVLPPTMAAGEGFTPLPATATMIDFRGTADGEGFRFNLSVAATGDTRSKLYIEDDFSADDADMDFGYSVNISGVVADPDGMTGFLAALNVQESISSQGGNFTGIFCGVVGAAHADSTNGTPRTVNEVRGGNFGSEAGGNTSVTLLQSLVASAPKNSGSGTVTNAAAFVAEAVTGIGSTLNLSAWIMGESEMDGAVGIGIAPNDTIGLLIADTFDFSLVVQGISEFDAVVGIGVTPNLAVGLSVVNPGTSGIEQYGIQAAFVSSVECTFLGIGVIGSCDTAAGSFTQATNVSLYAKNPTKGAGSTITDLYGVYIEDMTEGGTGNYGLYSAHTGESVFSGRVSGTVVRLTGATPTTGIAAAEIGIGRTTIDTIGANGAAAALTPNPLGYLKVNIAGTMAQIPYYNIA